MAYVKTHSYIMAPRPYPLAQWTSSSAMASPGAISMAALDDAIHQVGYVRWEDGGSSKTVTSIHLCTGAVTSPVGTLTVGLQGVVNSQPHIGDGTYTRSGTVDPSTLSADTSFEVAVSGTGSVSEGDLICVRAQMTSYTSGSMELHCCDSPTTPLNPAVYANTTPQGAVPCVLLEASGVFGILEGSGWSSTPIAEETIANGDQVGMIFSLPYNCKVDGAAIRGMISSSSGGIDVYLYSDPSGTPTAMSGFPITYTQADIGSTTSAQRPAYLKFNNETTLTKDTEYALVVYNNGASGNFKCTTSTVNEVAELDALAGPGNSISYITRTGSTGAFTETTTKFPWFSLMVTQIDDGSGGTGTSSSRSLPLLYK